MTWVDDSAYECIDDYPEHEYETQDERDGIRVSVCRRCGAEIFESVDDDEGSRLS